MANHIVPPNYDSSKFLLFGLVCIQSIIESAVAGVVLYVLLSLIVPSFGGSFVRWLVIFMISVLAGFFLMILTSKEPLSDKIMKFIKYKTVRRTLSYRRIRKRRRLHEVSSQEVTGEEESKGLKGVLEKNKKFRHKNDKAKKTAATNALLDNFRKQFSLEAMESRHQRYTQEVVGVDEIRDGIIRTKDGAYVKVLEIKAGNFDTMGPQEQLATMADFARLLKVGPVYSQFKIISKKSDLSAYINHIHELTNPHTESSRTLLNMADAVSSQLDGLSRDTTLEHSYYYIISYTPRALEPQQAFQEAYAELANYEESARSRLGRRGARIVPHTKESGSIYHNESEFLYGFLYEYYNRQSCKKEDVFARRDRVLRDTQKYREVNVKHPLKAHSIVAPRGIDFSHPDWFTMDGLYYSYLVITGFPAGGVESAWLDSFTNVGDGFDFDLLVKREDKQEIRKKLRRRNTINKSNVDQMQRNSAAAQDAAQVIHATNYMLNELTGDNEFFYFELVVTLSSATLEGVMKKKKWLANQLDSYNFNVRDPKYETEEIFRLVAPYASYEQHIFDAYKRNILTDGIMGFYPYTTSSITQIDGVAMGINKNNHSPVILDVFNPVSNMFVFGTTGFGKSFTCMLLATRLRMMQTQVYILAPIKGHEWRKIVREVDGSYIELGPGTKDCINVLEVRPVYRYEDMGSEEEDIFTEASYLNEKIGEVVKFFELVMEGTLTRQQQDLLKPFLVRFYARYGITDENDSIFVDGDRTKKLKRMPILGELRDALLESGHQDLRDLAIPLENFVEGSLKYFNHETNVDLDNKFCVVDMSKAMDYKDTKNLVIYIVQNYVWSKVKSDRTHRKAILYEEVWKLLDNKYSAEVIREVFKTIRGFYGIAIGITQNLADLTENAYKGADAILNNTLIQILMHNTPDEAAKMKDRFRLTDFEYQSVTGAQKGEALIVTTGQHFSTQIMATQLEQRLFETDGNKLTK